MTYTETEPYHVEQDGDGKIDVIAVRRESVGQKLRYFRRVDDGPHLTLDCVEYHQVQSFRIESQNADLLNLDGELQGHSPAAVEMLPGAIRMSPRKAKSPTGAVNNGRSQAPFLKPRFLSLLELPRFPAAVS